MPFPVVRNPLSVLSQVCPAPAPAPSLPATALDTAHYAYSYRDLGPGCGVGVRGPADTLYHGAAENRSDCEAKSAVLATETRSPCFLRFRRPAPCQPAGLAARALRRPAESA